MRTCRIFSQRISIYKCWQSGRHATTCQRLLRPIDSIFDCYQPDSDTLPAQAKIPAEVNRLQLTSPFLFQLPSIFTVMPSGAFCTPLCLFLNKKIYIKCVATLQRLQGSLANGHFGLVPPIEPPSVADFIKARHQAFLFA